MTSNMMGRMFLVIKVNNSEYIEESLETILETIRQETSSMGDVYLKDITKRSGHFVVTCPFHADHREKKPACTVFAHKHGDFEEGDYHCFVCNAHGTLVNLISGCFNEDNSFGKNWLLERFSTAYLENDFYLPPIDFLNISVEEEKNLEEKDLDLLESYHPYLETRKLSKEVCEKFKVGYEPKSKSIVFPVWDDSGKLYMLTRRSVVDKKFIIDAAKEKPVYLLNHIKEKDVPYAVVVESQINALTCFSYGIPSIAMFGVGMTLKQFEMLNKSNIRHYILAFDGDEAGRRAVEKFIKNIRKDVLIDVLNIPEGKDVNDLDKESFKRLFVEQSIDFDGLVKVYKDKVDTT
jgi:DNA primase